MRSAFKMTPTLVVAALIAGLTLIGWVAQSTLAHNSPQAPTPLPRKLACTDGSNYLQTLAFRQQLAMEHQQAIKKELLDVQSQKRKLEAQLKTRLQPEQTSARSATEADVNQLVDQDPTVARLVAQQEQLDAAKAHLQSTARSEAKGGDPTLKRLRDDLAQTKRSLESERKSVRPNVIRRLQEQGDRDQVARRDETQRELAMLNELEQTLVRELKSNSLENQVPPPIEAAPAQPPAGARSPGELDKAVPHPTPIENEDPEKNVQAFVEQNRKVAEVQLKNLRGEAEKLHSRLQKVEAGIKRWEALLTALQNSENTSSARTARDPGTPSELDPIAPEPTPRRRPQFNARTVPPPAPASEDSPPLHDSGTRKNQVESVPVPQVDPAPAESPKPKPEPR